jgi:hypothetical protein
MSTFRSIITVKDFFRFTSKQLSSTVQASSIGLNVDKNGVASEWNLIEGKFEEISFPVIFKHKYGKNFADILDAGWTGLFLISERLKNLLEENGLTGWKTYPIKLLDKKNKEISGYFGFSITGSCGPMTFRKSDIIDIRRVPEGPIINVYKGLYIGLDKWDKSDFFIPSGSYRIIVTKKTAEILKSQKITNLELTLEKIQTTANIVLPENVFD